MNSGRGAQGRYSAFISYSHALDNTLAPALQAGIEQFGRTWYQRRALRVFRDDSNLTATPQLWGSIEEALCSSSWFILLASPDAANSPWVAREVQWWLDNRSPERIMLGLTAGQLAWDQENNAVDIQKTDALPQNLVSTGLPEPRYVDFRSVRAAEPSDPAFQFAVAELAAPLHGIPKDDLVGEHVRQHRVRRRWIAAAISALTLLTVLSILAALAATNQRDRANLQTEIATARQLASAAQANISSRVDLARLLAVEAYLLKPDAHTRSALMQATAASPQLVKILPTETKVTSLSTSARGDEVVAGDQDGGVRVFDDSGNMEFAVAEAPAPVSVVAIDSSGLWLVAGNDRQLAIWDRREPNSLPRLVPVGGPVIDVGLSDSGRQLAVLESRSDELSENVIGQVSLLTTEKLKILAHTDLDVGSANYTPIENPRPHIAFGSEMALNVASGACNRISMRSPDLMIITSAVSTTCTPANRYIEASSPAATSGAYSIFDIVEVFMSAHPDAQRFARIPLDDKGELLSISRDAKRVAVVQSDAIFVTPTSEAPPVAADAIRLTGASGITSVEFLNRTRLVSAGEGGLQLWDTARIGALVQQTGLNTPDVVGFIDRPSIHLSPDSRFAAIADEEGSVRIMDTKTGQLRTELPVTDLPVPVTVAWAMDGRSLIVVGGDGSWETWRLDTSALAEFEFQRGPPMSVNLGQIGAAALSPDNKLYLIDLDGAVAVYDTPDVDAKLLLPGQANLSIGALLTLSFDARYVARATAQSIEVVELASGIRRQIDLSSPALSLEFLRTSELVVGRQDGVLEVHNLSDGSSETVLSIAGGNVDSLAVSADILASIGLDGSFSIVDFRSNQSMGRFQLPKLESRGIGTTVATATDLALTL